MSDIWDFKKEAKNFDGISIIMLIFLLALIAPILLLIIVNYTGYSEIVEEVFKAGVILFLVLKLPGTKLKVIWALVFAFIFSLSENVFWQRFIWTTPMHLATTIIILLFGLINKKLIIIGLLLSVFLHLLFNNIIVRLIVG